MAETRKTFAVGARFQTAGELYEAAKLVQAKGFRRWDAHSPFPVHGLDKVMELPHSPLGVIVFIGGLTFMLTAICLQVIPSTLLYKTVVSAKPTNFFPIPFSLPAFFPITFEITVLLSGFLTLGTMLALNGLPRWHHPIFNWDDFARSTDDGFFIVIEARDPKFMETGTSEFLEQIGGKDITLIAE